MLELHDFKLVAIASSQIEPRARCGDLSSVSHICSSKKTALRFLLPKLLRFRKAMVRLNRFASRLRAPNNEARELCWVPRPRCSDLHFKHFHTHMDVGNNRMIGDFVGTAPQHLPAAD
jgi:hypothetical protein